MCVVTGLKQDADLTDLLYIKARSKSVCLCMLSCCVSLCLSHSWIQTWTPPTFFPKPNRLCGFSIRISHPQVSDLLTMSPVKVSVMPNRDRIRL